MPFLPKLPSVLPLCAIEDPHLVVGAVGHVEIFLLRVARYRELVGRPARREVLAVETAAVLGALRRRVRRYVELLQELAVGREHLDAVLAALADVDLAVLRDLDEVQVGHEVLFFRSADRRSTCTSGSGSLVISLSGIPWPPHPRLNAPVVMSYTSTRRWLMM